MNSVRLEEVDLGFEVDTVFGAMLLMDEYSCTVLTLSDQVEPVIIRFLGCTQSKFGYPNDEALGGNELYKDCTYGTWEVFGSSWFDELQRQNKVMFPDVTWVRKRHFVCVFHECMGEFLADDIEVKRVDGDFDGTAMAAMRSALALQLTANPSMLPRREV
jgi:hypothetical protein